MLTAADDLTTIRITTAMITKFTAITRQAGPINAALMPLSATSQQLQAISLQHGSKSNTKFSL